MFAAIETWRLTVYVRCAEAGIHGGIPSWDIAELVSIILEQDAQGWLSAIVGHAKNL